MHKKHTDQPLNLPWMILCSVLVGVVAGIGALLFRMMIGFVHNLLFLGKIDFQYNANAFMPASHWGFVIIFIPVLGAVAVTWLVKNFAPEAKGHGVPEVMDAIYNKSGIIRPSVAIVKALASAISIGSGGSVGREGPIAQIGSAFASTLGQIIKMPARQRVVLIAAGASAGIAATFNAPVGGLTFAIELMLVSISATTVALVVFATVTATYIGRLFLGLYPAFNISSLMAPDWHVSNYRLLVLFIPFGIICGFASALMIRAIYWAEDFFDNAFKNPYLRHMTGMFLLGITMYCFMLFSGHYYVSGVGYAGIVSVLQNTLSNPWFLLVLFFGKLFVTSLTLGSGASGGVFSPSLFLGATLGGAFGGFAHMLFPGLPISQPLFAIAGMAALVGGSTGAVLTGIVMVFELTRDYNAILPVMLSVGLAYGMRTLLSRESIYTLKLIRRGATVPAGLQAALMATRTAFAAMSKEFRVVKLQDLLSGMVSAEIDGYTLVESDGIVLGLLRSNYIMMGVTPTKENIDDMVDTNFVTVKMQQQWVKILRAINQYRYSVIIVSKHPGSSLAKDIVGVITLKEIAQAAGRTAKLLD
jgi:chloride channel protein, CIC family